MSDVEIKPLSWVDIWNRALVRFAKEKVSRPDENSKAANAFRIVSPQVLQELLAHEDFPWNFARKVQALAVTEFDPSSGYAYAYQLPPDVITITGLTNEKAHYEQFGTELHTNEGNAVLVYVQHVSQASKFPPKFVKALALHLAYEVAFEYYKKSAAFLEKLKTLADEALEEAMVADARQDKKAKSQTSIFEEAAFGTPPGESGGVYTEPYPGVEEW